MTVKMILRIQVDPAEMERAAREGGEAFRGIGESSKQSGAIHHEFWAGNGEVLVVDEWESPDHFREFFEAQGQQIGQLMQSAGAQQPDEPRFYRKLDLGDEF